MRAPVSPIYYVGCSPLFLFSLKLLFIILGTFGWATIPGDKALTFFFSPPFRLPPCPLKIITVLFTVLFSCVAPDVLYPRFYPFVERFFHFFVCVLPPTLFLRLRQPSSMYLSHAPLCVPSALHPRIPPFLSWFSHVRTVFLFPFFILLLSHLYSYNPLLPLLFRICRLLDVFTELHSATPPF